ncbi:MAG: electron transport complex subunit RsxE [Candidatus Rokubacteria bacterium RIFCSPLOWO2_02_FULL_73_56]|nr:MAG: electron transport complex subunit RsxE [Candidatus Rokubacteria bacterium RIFCSPHIGHO2_02_FULL_73_26]OGL10483.1 MAG: electron transport complex subunit RsxE [Candidatus Rokubacteria bacterium RIFCSPLOWO2_02_FULL_73_56]OGL25492.1 MAG: electron transport complex subunit RsxE [Candidatus Rokubacteria bacterium RIFCSPLOWO2_12_FULL_73_47]
MDLLKGLWRENPVLIQLLGLCPTLAVTNSVANSVVMAGATFFVLVGSSLLVSLLKRFVPNEVRITSYILIIATFVSVAEMGLQALVPEIHKALGAFVALIVVNCIILGRQEAFAGRNPVGRSVLDAVGMGIGFTIALLLMGSVREILGSGTFLGVSLFGPGFEPWVIMVLPPGGFFTLAFVLLTVAWARQRRAARAAAAGRDAAVARRAA